MPPRLRLSLARRVTGFYVCRSNVPRHYATATAATVVSPTETIAPKYPPNQPPSHRLPQAERSQLHRQYTSLIRSTPMFLFFQHNNLTATEWAGIRRELTVALRKVDKQFPDRVPQADGIRISIIKSGIFEMALKVTDRYLNDPSVSVSGPLDKYGLSEEAYKIAKAGGDHPLSNVLVGPTAIVTFPSVSMEHLKTTLSILAPSSPDYKAPTRKANPGYNSPEVLGGVSKLMLLGGRMEGSLIDSERVRWAGLIQGGLDGLRAQLVNVLQGAGASLARTLEGTGQSLYFTMEGRKSMLDEESKEKTESS